MAYKNPDDQRAAWKRHYAENKQAYVDRQLRRKVENRELLNSLKTGCVRCGFENPAALDFHHRDPATKKKSIANMLASSRPALLRELEKCEVICANCHRIEHSGD